MIKEDYLVRMILEIISLIANALLTKKKYRYSEWVEYDCLTRQLLGFPSEDIIGMSTEELIDKYEADPNKMGKIELAGMTMLKLSDDMEAAQLLQKSKLRQDGLKLLHYVQDNSGSFSIQRVQLIGLLESNG